jgi:hypothetical protein
VSKRITLRVQTTREEEDTEVLGDWGNIRIRVIDLEVVYIGRREVTVVIEEEDLIDKGARLALIPEITISRIEMSLIVKDQTSLTIHLIQLKLHTSLPSNQYRPIQTSSRYLLIKTKTQEENINIL